MHDKLTTFALAGLVAAGAFVAIAVVGGRASTGVASTTLDPEEAAFMAVLNDYRAENDLGPILIDPSIQAAAEWMSTDMGVNDYFSHTDSTGGSPWDRMCDHGYCYNTWKGENIAAGYNNAAAVFQGWKGSPGHNANMLGSHYVVMGIAMVHTHPSTYGYYWTNDFGGHNPNPNPSPPPAPTNTPTPTSTQPQVTPTPTPAPTPTQTTTAPTPTYTPTPTPTPTEEPGETPSTVADIDCDQVITTADVLALLQFLGRVSSAPNSDCPPIGEAHLAEAGAGVHGDVDCSGTVDGRDALIVLLVAAEGDQIINCA